jgi:hypothetical protein
VNYQIIIIVGKKKYRKENVAILSLVIYNTSPDLQFSKDELKRISRKENQIRLSEEPKKLFDDNRDEPMEIHLDLNMKMNMKALNEYGYLENPEEILKAYHLATAKYINDPDVRDEV